MKISQKENGNILIQDLENNFVALMPRLFVFCHPRKQNTIMINGSGDSKDEVNSIEADLTKGVFVNGDLYNNIDTLTNKINNEIIVSGNRISNSDNTDGSQTDQLSLVFDSIRDYEQMYEFAKKHSNTVSPIKIDQSGRINKEEYVIQFTDRIVKIILTYYYLPGDQISHILMNGTTGNIPLPLKTYNYGSNGEITHTYEVSTWSRNNS
ncbi:hypothetical protein [uncultured Tenacibaculum sp.]|uniref:hypothetical protein n=1 Tax=uncultured Tenacibaculum sp. TaxID=174713 RepID=UPI0026048632|nr:hypothetical protein [uncultured Tenacibaculum sp.]